MNSFRTAVLLLFLLPSFATAQQGQEQQKSPCMPGMSMPGCPEPAGDQSTPQAQGANLMSMMPPRNLIETITRHTTSGTSLEPTSVPASMLMTMKGHWMLMFHANAFILAEQQSSPRGGDKFFSTNWFMPMAQHKLRRGVFTVRTMFSLEPATVTGRRYPLLFQQGETAFGVPIADGQHPHNFFMELAALYDLQLGRNTLLSFYAAPVGDPSIGPVAYSHRASAMENPVATLGHHQEDSTHIADDVVTVGLTYRFVRIEASGFHGREPDENRWTIHQGNIDSWAMRFTAQPGKNWSGQYSYARIKSPEALFSTENQERMTASIMYNLPFRNGNWASTILWGRTRALQGDSVFNSVLFESTVLFRARNSIWTRIEDAERSNELILGENPLPAGFEERSIGKVQGYTLGYDRNVDLIPHFSSAIGAQITAYGVPDSLVPIYGRHPVGVALFVRLRPVADRAN